MFAKLAHSLVFSVSLMLVSGTAYAQQIKIVALGHSFFVSRAGPTKEGYPEQLQVALKAKGHDVAMSNAGIYGDNIPGVLARLDKAVPTGTHIVVLFIGASDRRQGMTQAEVNRNLDIIVDRLRAKGAKVIMFGERPDPPNNKFVDEGGTVPLLEKLPDRTVIRGFTRNIPDELRADGGHLMGAGNKIAVERTVPVVEQVIAEVKQGR